MRHTIQQVEEALALVRMPHAQASKAWTQQLMADDPSAWFVVAARKARLARARDCEATTAAVAQKHGGVKAYAAERLSAVLGG